MIGNSWHLPTCRFRDMTRGTHQSRPHSSKFATTRTAPICRMASIWMRSGINWDPNEPRQPSLHPPGNDEFAHFQWALSLQWLDLFPVNLNPCLQWALDMQQRMRAGLSQWRNSVREDVQALVRELAEDQEEWMSAAPPHVVRVYKQGTGKNVVQLLAMAHLLHLFAFPEAAQLIRDLFYGFPLLGPLPPGAGWSLRQDSKYSSPWTLGQFEKFNAEHVRQACRQTRESQHEHTLRSEVEAEARKDRFVGPFSTAWLQANLDQAGLRAARAFPIEQNGKVRRGDDWLRSGHNSTVFAGDVPPYAGTQTVTSQLRYAATAGQPRLFAVDHEGAYRSLPVRHPPECCTILPGDPEVAVWMHQVLPFGSSGSVWSYIRVADTLCFLSIVLLWLAAAHFVDDFFGCENHESADHGFQGFQEIHGSMGYQMKEAKAKPPSAKITLLGVDWEISNDAVEASPGQGRVSKIETAILQALHQDSLTSAEAAKLAGKLGFATSWMFGSVGRAFLRPLFVRQHGSPTSPIGLSRPLRSSLTCLLRVLRSLKPVRIPLQPSAMSVAVLYADAYVTLTGHRRPANKWLQGALPLQALQVSDNGWGAVYSSHSARRLAFRSQVPGNVLLGLATSKAYIYWLEMLAQVLSLLSIRPPRGSHVVCFCDNVAAEHALRKGYSKDDRFTKVLACFWSWVAERSLSLTFHRVSSKENCSDGVSVRGRQRLRQARRGLSRLLPLAQHLGRVRPGRPGAPVRPGS